MRTRKILVPLDGSPISTHAVKGLIDLKQHATIPLTLLHVLDLDILANYGFPEKTFREFEKRARSEATKFIADQKELFVAAGIKVETIMKEGNVRETICELADSGEYDLLVIGKNSDGDLRNLLFGQVANYVIRKVKCPVLIV